ncbi:MAG: hypothetical protein N3F62_10395 [Bacteroidia bacterium]|nr:hypothetical protein [Bacteroidia bacterium]
MKKVSIAILTAALSIHLNAQSLKIDIKEIKHNTKEYKKIDVDYLGKSKNYIYLCYYNTKFRSLALKTEVEEYKLVAYDYNLNKAFSFNLNDLKGNDKLVTYKVLIGSDRIYLLCWERENTFLKLYGNVYDEKGQIITKRNKLMEINKDDAENANTINAMTYIVDQSNNGNLAVITERVKKSKNDFEVEYKLFDKELNFLQNRKESIFKNLDVDGSKLKDFFDGLTNFRTNFVLVLNEYYKPVGGYFFSNDNKLYANYTFRFKYDKDDQVETNILLSYIDPQKDKYLSTPIKINGKEFFNTVHFINSKNELLISGTFGDPAKARNYKKDKVINGVYVFKFDAQTLQTINQKYHFFDKNFLDKAFAETKELRHYGISKKEENGISDKFSLSLHNITDDGTFTFVLKYEYHYSESTTTGAGSNRSTVTRYYYVVAGLFNIIFNEEKIINTDAIEILKKYEASVSCNKEVKGFSDKNKYVLFYSADIKNDLISYKIYDLKSGNVIEKNILPDKISKITNNKKNPSYLGTCRFEYFPNMLLIAFNGKRDGQSACNCCNIIAPAKEFYYNLGTIKLRD